MAYRRSMIKAIQRGKITLGDNVLSNTATITAVVTANSVVTLLGSYTANGTSQAYTNTAFLKLTNTTTVTAARGANTADGVVLVVSFEVIEFYAFAMKQATQDVTITTTGGASGTASITAVVTTKAWVVLRGGDIATGGVFSARETLMEVELTNSTTVTGQWGSWAGSVVTHIHATVVEFN